MYTTKHYGDLCVLNRTELSRELQRAREHLTYLQEYDKCNEGLSCFDPAYIPVNYVKLIVGISNCETFIIEVERRLGVYNNAVSAMLVKRNFKGIQSRGVQASIVCQAESVQVNRQVRPFGAKKFRKFNKKGAVSA